MKICILYFTTHSSLYLFSTGILLQAALFRERKKKTEYIYDQRVPTGQSEPRLASTSLQVCFQSSAQAEDDVCLAPPLPASNSRAEIKYPASGFPSNTISI